MELTSEHRSKERWRVVEPLSGGLAKLALQ